MPKLNEVMRVISSLGFVYKTCAFTWIKKNKVKNTPFYGMGHWTASNAELCLLATKGKPKRVARNISSIIWEPITTHSEKPAIVRDKIVQLCGDLPRIEMFARKRVVGWDAFGNEL